MSRTRLPLSRVLPGDLTLACLILGCLMLGSPPAGACDTEISIEDLWIRQSAVTTASAAGFFRLRNDCAQPITLVSVTSPRFGRVELHQSVMQGGNWSMHRRDSVTVKAGETLVFQTGNLHLMLMDPEGAVEAGAEIPMLFHFEDGREVAATAEVRKR